MTTDKRDYRWRPSQLKREPMAEAQHITKIVDGVAAYDSEKAK
ncbi:hypothetical protein X759_08470 [Mesorhizobium sp. LSHC420B00]|nr:hypothetical protein X759_08470 [Mesorhizobium sp. LSHC420B00]